MNATGVSCRQYDCHDITTMNPQDTPNGVSVMIQIVGDQTVQNLLPVMALRPARIFQARSQDVKGATRFEDAADNFGLAVQRLSSEPGFEGYQPEIITETMDDTSPGIEATRSFVASFLAKQQGAVVNFTGATKLMSIGAYQAAAALGAPSLYCDTQEKRFTDGHTGKLDPWPDFRSAAAHLSVPLLMAAHGKNFGDWQHEVPTSELKEYGQKAFNVRRDNWDELDGFNKSLRPFFYRIKGRVPSVEADLRALVSEPLPAGVIATPSGHDLVRAATIAGLLQSTGKNQFIVNAEPRKRDVERVANLLIGSWVELAVLDMMEGHPRYQNPLWSVEPSVAQDADFGEMDIVCVDQRTASLRYISCKAVLDKPPLEHLEAVGDRAHRVGGTFAASTLVVFQTYFEQDQTIRRYAKRLRIDAAVGAAQIVHEFFTSGRSART
jgi:hypothetical protein